MKRRPPSGAPRIDCYPRVESRPLVLERCEEGDKIRAQRAANTKLSMRACERGFLDFIGKPSRPLKAILKQRGSR